MSGHQEGQVDVRVNVYDKQPTRNHFNLREIYIGDHDETFQMSVNRTFHLLQGGG